VSAGFRPLAIANWIPMTSVDELAADFWRRVGTPPPYPRDLEAPILWGLPLALVKLPRLRAGSVDEWFAKHGRAHQVAGRDRPLRACLFAARGRGVVFIDASDPRDEQRFSLGHEVGHFVADYLAPREAILSRMGPGYAEILDGLRRPLPSERIDSLLAGMTLGVHRHLMDRHPDAASRLDRAESRADRLALELLAPRRAVLRGLDREDPGRRVDHLTGLLTERFGLPISIAQVYANNLSKPQAAELPVRRWLGAPVELSRARRNREQNSQ